MRGKLRPPGDQRKVAAVAAATLAFYLVVFGSLTKISLDEPFWHEVYSRFWQQANLIVCLLAGAGLAWSLRPASGLPHSGGPTYRAPTSGLPRELAEAAAAYYAPLENQIPGLDGGPSAETVLPSADEAAVVDDNHPLGAARAQVDSTLGELHCIDARQDRQALQALRDKGLDIDRGMALMVDDKVLQGAEAAYVLAQAAPPSGLFNRANRYLFGSRRRAQLLYPPLLAGRNMLLRMLGRKPIIN